MVSEKEDVRFDRAHFKSFGDFALLYEIVYFVLKPEFSVYMDIQQAINLELVSRFEEMDVTIAFPTQKLFVEMESANENEGIAAE